MSDTPLPAVPHPAELRRPNEYIVTTGPIKWTKTTLKTKCEDCLHLILQHSTGQIDGPAPPLAHWATYARTQGGVAHLICPGHRQIRQENGEG